MSEWIDTPNLAEAAACWEEVRFAKGQLRSLRASGHNNSVEAWINRIRLCRRMALYYQGKAPYPTGIKGKRGGRDYGKHTDWGAMGESTESPAYARLRRALAAYDPNASNSSIPRELLDAARAFIGSLEKERVLDGTIS